MSGGMGHSLRRTGTWTWCHRCGLLGHNEEDSDDGSKGVVSADSTTEEGGEGASGDGDSCAAPERPETYDAHLFSFDDADSRQALMGKQQQ